jgi:hypothetical protein
LKKGDLGGFENHQWEGIFGNREQARFKFGGKGQGTSFTKK